jgi:prepilin-type N-terminal cleavage/methylation domain-containing protein
MNRRTRGFTLIEMLVVISIIGILAGMTVGISRLASDKMRRSRIKAELQALVMAIEAYKAKYDVYPPDNKLASSARYDPSAEHQLYYELTGCQLTNNQFQDQFFLITLSGADIKTLFGVGGFLNAHADLKETRNFLPQLKTNHVAALSLSRYASKPIYMLTVPVKGPAHPNDTTVKANVWHYNSSSPTNNSGRFDLWADVVIGGKRHIIGNWNE